MGDEGRLYVAEEIVPAYKEMIRHADLIVPNCFEAELLSGVKITDMTSLVLAITRLHKSYQIPNVIVTSLRIDKASGQRRPSNQSGTIAVVGSTCRKDYSPRIFQVTVPSLPIFFSGTGDMFAALMVVRLREAVLETPELVKTVSWQSADEVESTSLPLAKATEKTLASMHAVLMKTAKARDEEISVRKGSLVGSLEGEEADKKMHLLQTRASEVRVVRCVEDLKKPMLEGLSVKFKAEAVNITVEDKED
jgi:pyridoxine kinase